MKFPWQKDYISKVIVIEESSAPTCRWGELSPQTQVISALSPETNQQDAPFSPYFLRSELLSENNLLQLEAESLRLAKVVMAALTQH